MITTQTTGTTQLKASEEIYGLVGELTKALDDCLHETSKTSWANSYVWPTRDTFVELKDGKRITHYYYAIRFPGATRGAIEVDKHDVIIGFNWEKTTAFYETNTNKLGCYESKEKNEAALAKFIGKKLVIEAEGK